MIVGVGCDLVHVPRMARLLRESDSALLDELFSPAEQSYCRTFPDPAPHFAARFAAKEAFYKALGGASGRPQFRDVEVDRETQRCGLKLSRRARAILARAVGNRALLSLSHDGDYALALVLLEGSSVPSARRKHRGKSGSTPA